MNPIKQVLLLTTAILSIMATGHARFTDNSASYESFNNRYTLLTPPVGVDSTMMICYRYAMIPKRVSYTQRESLPDFEYEALEIPVVSAGDSLFIKMATLHMDKSSPEYAETKVWLKAIKEGNRIRFINDKELGYVDYDIQIIAVRPPTVPGDTLGYEIYVDTIVHQWDTIYQKTVVLGETTDVVPNELVGYYYRSWAARYPKKDVKAEYNEDSGLMRNPNNSILVFGAPQDFYRVPHRYAPGSEKKGPLWISTWNYRDMIVIKDFIIGQKQEIITDSLPTPEVKFQQRLSSWYKDGRYFYDYYLNCSIYMNLITDEGKLLDSSDLKVMIYIDDKIIGPESGLEMINPFKDYPYYTKIPYATSKLSNELDWTDWANDVEVMVYYEKEDGTRIESPRVRAINVSGVKDIQVDPVNKPNFSIDENVYDLTGRIVNPDNLSPGIYIQRGRKFLVR